MDGFAPPVGTSVPRVDAELREDCIGVSTGKTLVLVVGDHNLDVDLMTSDVWTARRWDVPGANAGPRGAR